MLIPTIFHLEMNRFIPPIRSTTAEVIPGMEDPSATAKSMGTFPAGEVDSGNRGPTKGESVMEPPKGRGF